MVFEHVSYTWLYMNIIILHYMNDGPNMELEFKHFCTRLVLVIRQESLCHIYTLVKTVLMQFKEETLILTFYLDNFVPC